MIMEPMERVEKWYGEHTRAETLRALDPVVISRPPDRITGIDSTGFKYKCPMCAHPLGHRGRGYGGYMDYEKFCPRCAQRIDWNRVGIHPGWGEYTYMATTGSVGYVEKED